MKESDSKKYYAQCNSEFGPMDIVMSDDGLQQVYFDTGDTSYGFEIDRDWVKGEERISQIGKQIEDFLRGETREFDIPFDLQRTEFQQDVWQELLKIPYGETRTYAEIAQAIGKPKAVRAVGTAIGKNPLPIIIPCHRVVATGGGLGGYAFGLEMKKVLLDLEKE